jgi:hypothetical protein
MPLLRRIAKRIPGAQTVAHRLTGPTPTDLAGRVEALEAWLGSVNHLAVHTSGLMNDAVPRLDAIDGNFDGVVNGLASFASTARKTARQAAEHESQMRELSTEVTAMRSIVLQAATRSEVSSVSDQLKMSHNELVSAVSGHAETQGWVIQRMEAIRSEFMHELRWGAAKPAATEEIAPQIVNQDALVAGELRLNLGCGTLPIPGFANVDMRLLPGVDIVAPAGALPVDSGSVTELFSAHFLEHFSEEELRRTLLPYWTSLLKPGGVFRAIVPDFEMMVSAWIEDSITFANLRSVIFGGQEYEGDFHYTMFTVESMTAILGDSGLVDIQVVERGRQNGDCMEMEVTASRPNPS